jgi:hypothetical protein
VQESKKCEGVSARVMRGCEEVRGNVSEIVRKTAKNLKNNMFKKNKKKG